MTSTVILSSSLGLFPIATSTKTCDLGTKRSKLCCFKERKVQKNVICACMAPTRNLRLVDSLELNSLFLIPYGSCQRGGFIRMYSSNKKDKRVKGYVMLYAIWFKRMHNSYVQGEVYIRGRKRSGLIGDDEISGLRIGLVFQSAALFDSLTVRENVGFLLYENSSMSGEQISQLVTENLAAVGLKFPVDVKKSNLCFLRGVEERLPSELSGGMKKRVALARSIICDITKESIEPEVLLYDEPTAGLDPIASTVVEDLICSVPTKGENALGKPGKIASYVVVTHQHSTIRRAVDRLLFLHEGKVVWQGITDEFTMSIIPIVRQFASGSLDGPIRY
ncbi:hypothetical protein CRYUN_Cryun05aG0064500 [Craigia yunnanensis]